MGLRTTSLSDRSKGDVSAGGGGASVGASGSISKGDRASDNGGSSVKSDGQGSRDKDRDGSFGWMGNLSRALARGQGDGVGKEGEEEVGREEDAQVARFVLMLLQYNFPFISHVRGDMVACLQELSAQVSGRWYSFMAAPAEGGLVLYVPCTMSYRTKKTYCPKRFWCLEEQRNLKKYIQFCILIRFSFLAVGSNKVHKHNQLCPREPQYMRHSFRPGCFWLHTRGFI